MIISLSAKGREPQKRQKQLNSSIKIYGEIPEMIRKKVNLLEIAGYIKANLPHISLTNSGMLISNSIITELLGDYL